MKFSFISLFPELIKGYLSESILFKAKEKKLISIDLYNPRDFTENKHKKVDADMVGGGAGMLMTAQPIIDTIEYIQNISKIKAHIIFLTPVGKAFKQNDAKRLSKLEHIIFISGRYEGIDERVTELEVDEVFSIGDFVLTGGELPSLILCDSISRNINGVLGNKDSLKIESFEKFLLEAPAFTKPTIYKNLSTPSEFSEGNHSKIEKLKEKFSIYKTQYFRPDLITKNKGDR